MKTTVIIPVRKSLNSLKKTLESLSLQDPHLISKVVVVENGSNEIKDLNYQNFTLQILKLNAGNRSKARNIGTQNSTSEIYVFLDADVILEPNWISEVLKNFDENTLAVQTPIIPSSYKKNLLQKIRKSRTFFKNDLTFFSLKKDDPRKMVLNSAAFAVRSSIFKHLQGFDENLYRQEDLDFTQRLLSLNGLIKATSLSRCNVFFEGSLWDYFKREFDSGYQVVRYHEKWTSSKIVPSLLSLADNFHIWFKSLFNIQNNTIVEATIKGLELTYLLGNAVGILRKLLQPYPGQRLKHSPIVAKLVYIP